MRFGGRYAIAMYPILLAFAAPVALTAVVRTVARTGAATALVLCFLAIRGGMFLLIPPAMSYAIVAEQQVYRPGAPLGIVNCRRCT